MPTRKTQLKKLRQHRVRSKIYGTTNRPRLTVFRSNKFLYAQIIDDTKGATLFSQDDRDIKKTTSKEYKAKTAKAYEVGLLIGKSAIDKKITKIVFDRSGYKYHGRVKALAEGAREAGLEF